MSIETWLGLLGLVAGIAAPMLGMLIRVVQTGTRIEHKLDAIGNAHEDLEKRVDDHGKLLGEHGNRLWKLETRSV